MDPQSLTEMPAWLRKVIDTCCTKQTGGMRVFITVNTIPLDILEMGSNKTGPQGNINKIKQLISQGQIGQGKELDD